MSEFKEWLCNPQTKAFKAELIKKREELKEDAVMRLETTVERLAICQVEIRTEARILKEVIEMLTEEEVL